MLRFFLCFLLLCGPVIGFAQKIKNAYALGVEGIQKVDAGQYSEGIKLLTEARNLKPTDYDYPLEIGKAYLKSGNAKKAERFLYDLQYHVNVQPDLFVLLSQCYSELNKNKKTPDTERTKEIKALLYGIAKLPNAGILYLQLGQLRLELEQPANALAIWEKGIQEAPNFAENYFWAARMLDVSKNTLWAWVYGETFLNITDNLELKRSIAPLVFRNSEKVLNGSWEAYPDKLDQDLKQVQAEFCNAKPNEGNFINNQVEARICLLKNWKEIPENIAPFFQRIKLIKDKGWVEEYIASMFQEVEKEAFLGWLAEHSKTYDSFVKWNYWNKLNLNEPISRQE